MHPAIPLLAAAAAVSSGAHATAQRTHQFTIALPVADAFPLFEPIGEKNWAEGWQPEFASAEGATLSDGTVFTVQRPGEHGAPIQTVWLITRYNRANHVIEYRMVAPGERVSRITVQCQPTSAKDTAVTVTYHYTGLSENGDRYIAQMTDDAFRAMIGEWDTAIRAYLQRGTPATP